jgi:hypothetical protein
LSTAKDAGRFSLYFFLLATAADIKNDFARFTLLPSGDYIPFFAFVVVRFFYLCRTDNRASVTWGWG